MITYSESLKGRQVRYIGPGNWSGNVGRLAGQVRNGWLLVDFIDSDLQVKIADTNLEMVENTFGMVCPTCGDPEHLDVLAKIFVRVMYEGTDPDEAHDRSHEWDGDSPCVCGACDWSGTVADTQTEE